MKPIINFFLILSMLGFLLVGCDGDNFDELIEDELPFTPTEVEETDSKFSYKLQGVTKNLPNGFGLEVIDGFYAISSDSIFCGDNFGSYRTKAQELGFLIDFFMQGSTIVLPKAALARVINGDTVVGFSGFLQNCGTAGPPTVTITNQTPSLIEGSFEGEFFQPIVSPASSDNCNEWQSLGILTADFSVPVDTCQ